jgi:hypothetical protein
LSDEPIIDVNYIVKSHATGKEIEGNSEFIESLHHKSWIVQVRQLKGHRRNDAENMLAVFDQDNQTNDKHILNIEENEFPEKYRFIIKKLKEACETAEVREKMQLEDDYFNELIEKDELIAKLEEENRKIIAEKDQSLAEKDQSLAEKDQSLAEKDKELLEQQKRIAELEKQLKEKSKDF